MHFAKYRLFTRSPPNRRSCRPQWYQTENLFMGRGAKALTR